MFGGKILSENQMNRQPSSASIVPSPAPFDELTLCVPPFAAIGVQIPVLIAASSQYAGRARG